MKYHEYLEAISEELIGIWDAAEDHGESDLVDALAEASEKGEGALARKIFEGVFYYVAEILLSGNKEEINRLIGEYENSQRTHQS
jgi:hypothetical protein